MKPVRMSRVFLNEIWNTDPGFYVEIGAWDGRKKNSTIILEQAGWDGVCIEPSPASFDLLTQNRQCRCLNVAVYDRDGEVDFALFPSRPEWNGIIESYDDLHKQLLESDLSTASIVKIPCKAWNSLNLPAHIDYLQIDVEGAELPILRCIDWTTTNISYICLEDNHAHTGDTTYKDYMESLGYTCIATSGVDFLYTKFKT
jgi:FkbM family methyltransferase